MLQAENFILQLRNPVFVLIQPGNKRAEAFLDEFGSFRPGTHGRELRDVDIDVGGGRQLR